jgi:hypothetical protein
MAFFKRNIFPLFICPLLFACNAQRYMYSTPASNVCYFKQKNDSKLAAYYYEGGNGNTDNMQRIINTGYDIQAGYAYSNNWAVTAAYSSRTEKDSSFNNYDFSENKSEVNYKRNLFELGLGRFSLNKNKNSTGNVFFGIGFGNYSIYDNGIDSAGRYSKYHRTAFVKFYIQPSYNIVSARYVHASIGGRINFMHYGNSSSTYTDGEKNYWGLNRLNRKLAVFAEPNFNLQLSLPEANWIRFETNINFQLFDIGYPEATRLSQRKGGVSIGFYFDPAAAFQKANK